MIAAMLCSCSILEPKPPLPAQVSTLEITPFLIGADPIAPKSVVAEAGPVAKIRGVFEYLLPNC